MENYCPTLLAYVPVFLACRQPSAVVTNPRRVTIRIVSPGKKVSYTLTAGAGDELLLSTQAASGSLRADAVFVRPLTSTLLTPAVFGQVVSKSTYFAGTVLNPNESGVTATFNVHDRDRSLMGTRADSIGGKRTVSRALT